MTSATSNLGMHPAFTKSISIVTDIRGQILNFEVVKSMKTQQLLLLLLLMLNFPGKVKVDEIGSRRRQSY